LYAPEGRWRWSDWCGAVERNEGKPGPGRERRNAEMGGSDEQEEEDGAKKVGSGQVST
jgi:hypothetical protein